MPFDIKLTSIKPYNESEYKYLFSYSGISLELKRSTPGLLFGGFYFPTGIFALLSLVSFSIDLQMVPGRLGLLVTLYLIMTNVYISVEGPKSRGFRCEIFGFFSSRSLKTREKYISTYCSVGFAQFVYFLREVCLSFKN